MDINWQELFTPKTSLVEIVIRGSAMYLSLLAVLRVLVRRYTGSMSLMDLLLMVLIADAAQNAMAGKYESLTEGIVLCATLIGWNWLLDVLSYRSPLVSRLLEPPPLELIRHGEMLRQNMRKELITENELWSQLREQGFEELSAIKVAYIEPNGKISVLRR